MMSPDKLPDDSSSADLDDQTLSESPRTLFEHELESVEQTIVGSEVTDRTALGGGDEVTGSSAASAVDDDAVDHTLDDGATIIGEPSLSGSDSADSHTVQSATGTVGLPPSRSGGPSAADADPYDATQIAPADSGSDGSGFDSVTRARSASDELPATNSGTRHRRADQTRDEGGRTRATGGQTTPGGSEERFDGAGGPAGLSGRSRYRLIEPIAAGGMGRIWRAVDRRLHREVAFKELLDLKKAGRRIRQRFVEEAQITGQLEHPGIVPIYELSDAGDAAPYYAMKLLHGTSLSDAIREYHSRDAGDPGRRLEFVRLVRRVIDVCNAVGFAHQRGVLHRDLKPANIMIGDFGETLVLDWGLARVVEPQRAENMDDATLVGGESLYGQSLSSLVPGSHSAASGDALHGHTGSSASSMLDGSTAGSIEPSHLRTVHTDQRVQGTDTLDGEVLGTIFYMSPEQAAGQHEELDGRADIYSIGAILYEILTGQRTIAKGRMKQMVRSIREGDIIPPRKRDAHISPALEAICLKALATDRRQRYVLCQHMAADLEAWLADEPVSVHADPLVVRCRRWARRHRTRVVAGVTAMGMLMATGMGWWMFRSQQRRSAEFAVRTLLDEAATLVNQERYDEARTTLEQAQGRLQSEPSMTVLAAAVQSQQVQIDRLVSSAEQMRLERVRQNVAALRDTAMQFSADDRPDKARATLVEARLMLDGEAALSAEQVLVTDQLRIVEDLLAARDRRNLLRQKFAAFQAAVDDARLHASMFTGELVGRDFELAQQSAQTALNAYPFDQPDQLQQQADELTGQEREVRQQAAFEMKLILAESKLTLSTGKSLTDRQAAAEAALALLDQAEAINGTSRTLELRRAECFETLGRSAELQQALTRADAVEPVSALDFFLLGEFERKQGRLPTAVVAYRRALIRDPDHFWSMHFLGLCLFLQGDPEAAIPHYTACIARRPEFVWSYLARSVALSQIREFEGALSDLAKAEQLAPELYAVNINRGGVLLAQEQFDDAIACFEQARDQDPTRVEPWLNLGESHRRKAVSLIAAQAANHPVGDTALPDAARNELQQAIALLDQGARIDPTNARIYRVRGDIRRRLKEDQKAIVDLRLAAQLDTRPEPRADDLRQVGAIQFAAGRFQEAAVDFRSALAITPDNAELHRLLAESLLEQQLYEDAIAALTEALRLGDPVPDEYRARGLAHARLGRYREAMHDYTRALEMESSPNIFTRRGWAYLLQATQLAERDFQDAIRLNPDAADSYNGLAYSQILAGRVTDAVATAATAVEKSQPQIEREGSSAWTLLYNASTIYAIAAGRTGIESEDGRRYAAEALRLLDETLRVGGPQLRPTILRAIQTDSSFQPLQPLEEFRTKFVPPAN